jgi:hypothetical protein
VWNLLTDKYSRKALTIAERYADGDISGEKLGFAWGDARRAAQVTYREERQTADAVAMWAVARLCETEIVKVVEAVDALADCEAYPHPDHLVNVQTEQAGLLRDVFCNPFRPAPAIVSAWLTPTVLALAHAAYDHRILPTGFIDPVRLGVLADALEEVGADSELLGHLRSPGPHVRGCWALDAILSKK